MWSSTDRLIAFLIWIRHQVIVSLVIFIIISTVISLSISVYSAFYFFYVPTHTFSSEPLNFLFTPCDVNIQNEKGFTKCSFPTATVNLKESDSKNENSDDSLSFFQPKQKYTLQLHISLVSSNLEKNGKMFVVCLALLDYNDNTISYDEISGDNQERCVTSTIFSKSIYAKFVEFLLRYPIQAACNIFEQSSLCYGLSITTELMHWTKITFHEKFEDLGHHSIAKALITIKDIGIEPLEATFHVHESNLILWKDPILYLMTNHSNLTCLITVLTITIPVLILILMGWDRLTKPRIIKQADDVEVKCNPNSLSQLPSSATKFSVDSKDLPSRYDQARQRLKACKAKQQFESQDQEWNSCVMPLASNKHLGELTDSKSAHNVALKTKYSQGFSSSSLNQPMSLTNDKSEIKFVDAQNDGSHQSIESMKSIPDLKSELNITDNAQIEYPSKHNDKYDTCIRRRKET